MERWQHGGRFGRAKRAWLGGLLACVALVAEARAQAPLSPPVESPGYAEAIGEAVAHYAAGEWQKAREAFARAHALQPSARTFRGLGLAAFYLDDFAEAREAFEQALADQRKPLPDDQRRELEGLVKTCARNTGRLELHLQPASARVELDGVARERPVLFLARGEHVLVVSAQGHVPLRTTLQITGGEERSLGLTLAPAPAPDESRPTKATEPLAPVPARVEPRREASGRVFTWIAAAAVPVFAGTAAAVWFTGQAERDAIEAQCALDGCDQPEADRRFDAANLDTHAALTNVSLAAGGVALVAATVLFFVEGAEAPSRKIEVQAGYSGAVLRGRF